MPCLRDGLHGEARLDGGLLGVFGLLGFRRVLDGPALVLRLDGKGRWPATTAVDDSDGDSNLNEPTSARILPVDWSRDPYATTQRDKATCTLGFTLVASSTRLELTETAPVTRVAI